MIVPVKKVKIFILEEHKEQLLLNLQTNNYMMIEEDATAPVATTKFEDEVITRANTVLKRLSNYQNKKGFFEYHTVPYDDFVSEDDKRIKLLRKTEDDFETYDKLVNENEVLTKQRKRISPFSEMKHLTKNMNETLYVTFHQGFIPEDRYEEAKLFLKEEKIEHEFYEQSDLGFPIVFVLDKDNEEILLDEIKKLDYSDAKLPELDIPLKKFIKIISKDITENNERITYLEKEFTESKELEVELKILIDQTLSKIDRLNVPFRNTDKTVYVTGWVREDQVDALKESISQLTTTFDLDVSEPEESDKVPTALENNKFVKQFETLTDMFSTPNTNEVDPNPVMSIWYWIIFGIMMGDVGYGFAILTLFGLFIKFKKPKGDFSKLVHVFFYSGITAVIAGFIFGSVFGAEVNFLGFVGNIFGQNWNSFSIMEEPLAMLIFSVGLGVLHLISGLILKVRIALKHNDPLTALADGGSWIAILLGGTTAVVGKMVLNSNPVFYIGLALVAIGILLILTLAGRDEKGVFSKVTSGLGGLYNSTNYLSDLLSYSRILALALSTSVIALTMNILAGLVQGSFVGFLASLLIYLVGHTFNFAMGLLSTYVHDSRLQYIEFFNKFYEGGGTKFKPLSFKTENINEITH